MPYRHLQDVRTALKGAARSWQEFKTNSWLETLLPLTTFLEANLLIYFLGKIKINAGFRNLISNPIWKNQAHAAWQPGLSGLCLAEPGVIMVARTSEQARPTFPFLLQGSLECKQPQEAVRGWAGGMWWKEALGRPEASSTSDLLRDFESSLFSRWASTSPSVKWEEQCFYEPYASKSLKECV